MKPLCFVLMPFGRKLDTSGKLVQFDAVYSDVIAPAITEAGLEPIRADEEQVGGSIHKPMFERLLLCDFAIADLTTANPNVYYELGVRHGLRPRSTIILFSEGTSLPFDVSPLRGLTYRLNDGGCPEQPERSVKQIAERLKSLRRDESDDSPLFQLIADMPRPVLTLDLAESFRERTTFAGVLKARIEGAQRAGVESLRRCAADKTFEDLGEVEAGVIVGLYQAFRDVAAYDDMLVLYARMPPTIQRIRLVQEQRGFALNRLGHRDDAERVLRQLIVEHGPSSETNGLLGRVYKDRWRDAVTRGQHLRARGELKRAIEVYMAGFEIDWRDPYPGVNALSLMELLDDPDPRQGELAPVVLFAAMRRARSTAATYWDHATLVETALLSRDYPRAEAALADALPRLQHAWWAESTLVNLGEIRLRRQARGEDVEALAAIEAVLRQSVEEMQAGAVAANDTSDA